jgi:hypothetical protein
MNSKLKYHLANVFICLNLCCFAQENTDDCNLLPMFNSESGIQVSLSIITEDEYLRLESQYPVPGPWESINSDSAELKLIRRYPAIFVNKNNCYFFKSVKNKIIAICKDVPAKDQDDKTFQDYKVVNISSNYVTFISIGYESEVYYIVDPEKNTIYISYGRPDFSKDFRFAYSHSNDYGDERITIIDLVFQRDVCLTFDNWYVESGYFIEDNGYRLKMIRYDGQKTRYLNIQMPPP